MNHYASGTIAQRLIATITQWISFQIKVNEFTSDEWPPQLECSSFSGFDIGREQSNSHVIHIAWSPPGLAIHDRCVLAVLTSNGMVSLWASASDTRDQASWKRVLLVGNLFPVSLADTVRSLAWAPRTFFSSDLTCSHSEYILATGLYTGRRVQFYNIWSPFTGEDRIWSATDLYSLTISARSIADNNGSLLQYRLDRQDSVDSMTLAPLWADDTTNQIVSLCYCSGFMTASVLTSKCESFGDLRTFSQEIWFCEIANHPPFPPKIASWKPQKVEPLNIRHY